MGELLTSGKMAELNCVTKKRWLGRRTSRSLTTIEHERGERHGKA